ncbi:DedA family protein [Alkalilimnicola sp. S0819]|nr:DedA family protein [Alkalilimnicola sp. S0819]MPQ17318.1 DedA family protein [Alkalilimnicola sp. S0819]
MLAGLILQGYEPLAVWATATAGNTLGSAVNWALGRYLLHYQDRRWFPVKQKSLAKSQAWFQRWGVWSLLLAWLPVGGDPLTLVAGVMRVNFWLFLLLVAAGKAARYAFVIYAAGFL